MHDYMYCGLDCVDCEYKDKCSCKGCRNTSGEQFFGTCRVAKCAIKHDVTYCYQCKEFPCQLLNDFSYDKEHGDNGKRIKTLEELKECQ